MLISIGSRLVLLPGSGLENAVEILLGSSGLDSLQPGTLGEAAELDRCAGVTATHEEIHNSLLRTNRLQRNYLL